MSSSDDVPESCAGVVDELCVEKLVKSPAGETGKGAVAGWVEYSSANGAVGGCSRSSSAISSGESGVEQLEGAGSEVGVPVSVFVSHGNMKPLFRNIELVT